MEGQVHEVELRADEVARLINECAAAPDPVPNKPTPPFLRIVEMLASSDRRNWATALEVGALLNQLRKTEPRLLTSLVRFVDRCLNAMASLLTASGGSVCFRAACTALLDAYGILDVPGCEAQIAGNTIELTKRILGVYNEAVQSKNLDLLRASVQLVELAMQTKKIALLNSIWRGLIEPFCADVTFGKEQPRLLVEAVKGLLSALETAVRDATIERLPGGKEEKLCAFFLSLLVRITKLQAAALDPGLYIHSALRMKWCVHFSSALSDCLSAAVQPDADRYTRIVTAIFQSWADNATAVAAALPLIFLSPDAASFAASACLSVLCTIVDATSASSATHVVLFERALDTSLELATRAVRALDVDSESCLQLSLLRLMLAAYAEDVQAVQLHLVRALLHPHPGAAQLAALQYRVLCSFVPPALQSHLQLLLIHLAEQGSNMRLCRLAAELNGDAAYVHLVSSALTAPLLTDPTWLLAASTVEACASLPPSPTRQRHITGVVATLCTRRLSEALTSGDLSHSGYLSLYLSICIPSSDFLPTQVRARTVVHLLQLIERADLRASPHFHAAARRTILLMPAFSKDFSNSQGITMLSSFASLLAIPALAPIVRNPIARALEVLHFPRPGFEKTQLLRLQQLYRSLFATLGAQIDFWPAAVSFLSAYAAWAAQTPFEDVEKYLPAHIVPVLESFLQPSVHPASIAYVAERALAVRREQSNSQIGNDGNTTEAWVVHVAAIRKAVAALQELSPQVRARAPIASLIAQLSALQ